MAAKEVHVHYHETKDVSGPELRAMQIRDFNTGVSMIDVKGAKLSASTPDISGARSKLTRALNDIHGLLTMLRAMS